MRLGGDTGENIFKRYRVCSSRGTHTAKVESTSAVRHSTCFCNGQQPQPSSKKIQGIPQISVLQQQDVKEKHESYNFTAAAR